MAARYIFEGNLRVVINSVEIVLSWMEWRVYVDQIYAILQPELQKVIHALVIITA